MRRSDSPTSLCHQRRRDRSLTMATRTMAPLLSWIATPLEGMLERAPTKEIPGVSVSPFCIRQLNKSFFAAWVPGQGVKVDFAAMVEILIQQLDGQRALYISFRSLGANASGQMMRSSNPPPSNGFTNSYTLLKM